MKNITGLSCVILLVPAHYRPGSCPRIIRRMKLSYHPWIRSLQCDYQLRFQIPPYCTTTGIGACTYTTSSGFESPLSVLLLVSEPAHILPG